MAGAQPFASKSEALKAVWPDSPSRVRPSCLLGFDRCRTDRQSDPSRRAVRPTAHWGCGESTNL